MPSIYRILSIEDSSILLEIRARNLKRIRSLRRSMEKSLSNRWSFELHGLRVYDPTFEWHFHAILGSAGNCVPNRDTDWVILRLVHYWRFADVCRNVTNVTCFYECARLSDPYTTLNGIPINYNDIILVEYIFILLLESIARIQLIKHDENLIYAIIQPISIRFEVTREEYVSRLIIPRILLVS